MLQVDYTKLDNPAWHALSEVQQYLQFGNQDTRFFLLDYCPFGGVASVGGASSPDVLAKYATLTEGFFVIGNKPLLPAGLTIDRTMICVQMIIHNPIEVQVNQPIVLLEERHHEALYRLVNLVQPGYFRQKTRLLGDYYGIFVGEELVAVAGERMKINEFTEVSAIVNHPAHTGRGYATQLTAHVVNRIFEQGKLPFLHVVETNAHAIRLYEKLGFKIRQRIPFYHIIQSSTTIHG